MITESGKVLKEAIKVCDNIQKMGGKIPYKALFELSKNSKKNGYWFWKIMELMVKR